MNNPDTRVQNESQVPYGIQYLDNKSQATAASRLGQYFSDFQAAKTPDQREKAFAGASRLRGDLQQQTGHTIDHGISNEQAAWKKSDGEILGALDKARQIRSSGDKNLTIEFARLQTFGAAAFTSPRNAQAFRAMQQEHPEKLEELAEWAKAAGDKTKWAQGAIQSDPLARTAHVPDVPRSFLDASNDKIPLAHYGDRLLLNYQNVSKDYGNAAQLYHAASEGGPIKQEYLRAHTPPKPEWQQEMEEIFCRLAVGTMPVVNLLTDQICPKSGMSDDARKGVDIASGLLNGSEEAIGHFPNFAGSESKVGRPADVHPKEMRRPEASETPRLGSPSDIPRTYASKPTGELHPLANSPGIFVDDKGQRYMQADGKQYPVRFDTDHQTWRLHDPQNPTRPGIPIKQTNDGWRIHGEVGLPGGSGLSSKVASLMQFKNNPRVARLLNRSNALQPQKPGHCFLDHTNVAREAAGQPEGRLRPINNNLPLNAQQLQDELRKGPLVLSGVNVARPGSAYSGMHTIALLDNVDQDGKHYVLGVDLDDTIQPKPSAQDIQSGSFGVRLYDTDELTQKARPYVDPDTGNRMEMYSRIEPKLSDRLKNWFADKKNVPQNPQT